MTPARLARFRQMVAAWRDLTDEERCELTAALRYRVEHSEECAEMDALLDAI